MKTMFRLQGVTKRFGRTLALDDVSLEAPSGSVVALLGENGAGKTTSLKILLGLCDPDRGEAEVLGLNSRRQGREIRRRVGYVPDRPQMYGWMTVDEAGWFAAGFHGPNTYSQFCKLVQRFELSPKQKLKTLSKGQLAKVSLAVSMAHEPELLILDEPTSGLDPNQLVDIRQLIRTIGKEKTVMLSTHIMQEVEAISDRVIIINKGKIVADKKAAELQSSLSSQQIITVEFDKAVDEKLLKKITGVEKIVAENNNTFKLYSTSQNDLRPAVSQFAQQQQLLILTLQKEEQKLESIFRELTS